MTRIWSALLLLTLAASLFAAADPDRDFSGKWYLDRAASELQLAPANADAILVINQRESSIQCSNEAFSWSYALNGEETASQAGGERRSSVVKWEGAALLINTLVSGVQNYTIMDRWRLSADHSALNISRQVIVGTTEKEGRLVYRREPLLRRTEDAPPRSSASIAPAGSAPRLEPTKPAEYIVRAGTRILLALENTVDTKHSHEGDRVYLRTAFPVYENNRLIIPQHSAVMGTLTRVSQPSRNGGKAKGELYIRFDTLTLPNGVTRDFRSRLGSAGGAKGTVDPEDGKVTADSDHGKDARTVATTGTMGAAIGGLATRTMTGAGLGGAVGAGAGLAGILLKRGQDASIPRGTTLEMILDRDLHFAAEELR